LKRFARQTFVPKPPTLYPARKTLEREVQTVVAAFKTKGFFLQKTLFFSRFLSPIKIDEDFLEFWGGDS
jgi:hypothetical protein